jgi:Swi5-dependent recombination DNA repair protein 1
VLRGVVIVSENVGRRVFLSLDAFRTSEMPSALHSSIDTSNMSSPLPFKRRKLNDALNKPFVSPMRSAKAPRAPLQENSNLADRPYTPSTLAHTVQLPASSSPARPPSRPVKHTPVKSTPIRRQPAFSTSSKRTDPAEAVAQKALTALEMKIKAVRNEIDTLQQAARILSSPVDEELEALKDKWRLAAQQAAEELFGTVKERVCRMGGVAAWRESEKRKYDRAHGLGEFAEEPEEDDDADCEFDSQGEELPEDEQEYRKTEKRRMKQERMDAMDEPSERCVKEQDEKPKVWQEELKDDDVSFPFLTFLIRANSISRHSRWT